MNTKLTLSLKQEVIKDAKKYASKKKISLSKIIETYLQFLTIESKPADFEISPFIKGMATGVKIPADFDYKNEYSESLSQKYR